MVATFQVLGKFSTLDETNYIGNPHLCGSVINNSCDDHSTISFDKPDSQSGDEETVIDMEIFYWSLGVTYGVTWVAIIVFLCFDSPWRRAWFRLVEAFISCFKCKTNNFINYDKSIQSRKH
ncbi:unnamed protein product [Thlaspi arvense]|uniref:Uncharacterized protein n=1 Tax=Thlaspi arvense TaxID=13288 RepID=A0AAU9RT89_THLAR|nr:unnamed protein product [Thlaspi arvense]